MGGGYIKNWKAHSHYRFNYFIAVGKEEIDFLPLTQVSNF